MRASTSPEAVRAVLRVAPVLVAALLVQACASAGLPPPGAPERARAAASYSASLRVKLDGPELTARVRVLVAFRRPDALRIEVPGPTGVRLVAVTRDGRLTAVFPSERAVFQAEARAAELEALLGVGLEPAEVMDLLIGVPSPRLRAYRAWWGEALPRKVEATLPDGGRLGLDAERPEAGVPLPARAFDEPPHAGYRPVDAAEARRMWGAR